MAFFGFLAWLAAAVSSGIGLIWTIVNVITKLDNPDVFTWATTFSPLWLFPVSWVLGFIAFILFTASE